jgi:predicted alpha/beta hydrolase family esterase
MTLLYFLLRVESELIASVKRHIEQPVVIVEHGLGAIAMVNVPVKDTHLLQIEWRIECYFCR